MRRRASFGVRSRQARGHCVVRVAVVSTVPDRVVHRCGSPHKVDDLGPAWTFITTGTVRAPIERVWATSLVWKRGIRRSAPAWPTGPRSDRAARSTWATAWPSSGWTSWMTVDTSSRTASSTARPSLSAFPAESSFSLQRTTSSRWSGSPPFPTVSRLGGPRVPLEDLLRVACQRSTRRGRRAIGRTTTNRGNADGTTASPDARSSMCVQKEVKKCMQNLDTIWHARDSYVTPITWGGSRRQPRGRP